MANDAYDMQSWDTTSYVNPTRMNHIEQGIGNALTNGNNSYLGAKNLNSYPYYETSHTDHNVVWTDNGDGTVTANGKATSGNSDFGCHSHVLTSDLYPLILPNGKYIVSGCPTGGSTSTYYIQIGCYDTAGENFILLGRDTGDGVEITLNGDYYSTDSVRLNITCRIYTNYTANNLLFKPMIRLAGDNDNTWQPYSKTNQELTSEIYKKSLARIMGAKNLNALPYFHNSQELNGITWTVNSDGTVKAVGLASADSTFICHSRTRSDINGIKIPNGKYILTGCPSGGGTSTYIIGTGRTYNGSFQGLGNDTGNGVGLILDGDDYSETSVNLQIAITIKSGQNINLLFKPMLRPAEDNDDTWTPYAMTNKALTENKLSFEQADSVEENTWNLLRQPYFHNTQNLQGVDFVVNEDGSVTADGTASSTGGNLNYNFKRYNVSNYHLPKGTYFMSGCPSGGQLSTYRMRVGVSANTSTSPSYPFPDDFGNGAFFTITDESVYLHVTAVIIAGVTVENLTFRPRIIPVNLPACDKTTAGTYTLQCVVDANGNQTYSWVSSV